MVNLSFFLKFKSQLRRTRPDIVRQSDESLMRFITDAGGKITGSRTIISATFNEDAIGFWLNIYILIENLIKIMESSPEYFGYTLVLNDIFTENYEPLCRFLTSCGGGVYIEAKIVKKIIPYAIFDKPSQWSTDKRKRKYGSGSYYKIKELKNIKSLSNNDMELKDDISEILTNDPNKNILIYGSSSLRLRDGFYEYYKKNRNNFPVLSICFGSTGLGAFVDAWSLSIRSIFTESQTAEIDALWELLFRERIRDEISDYITSNVKKFLVSIFNLYIKTAVKKNHLPVLALENIHLSGKKMIEILFSSLSEIDSENSQLLIIHGITENDMNDEKLRQWESLFNSVIRIDEKKYRCGIVPKLARDLWEIVYAVSLMGKFFPPELFQRLFEEVDVNPAMVAKAFSILYQSNVINNAREPWPINKHIEDYAYKMLGDKAANIKTIVCSRLIHWVNNHKINPCFKLLMVLSSLNGEKQITDLLILKSISSDILNGTTAGIESALYNKKIEEIIPPEKLSIVKYIISTSTILHYGRENEIDNAFTGVNKFSDETLDSFPVLKSQIIINYCGYHLGRYDISQAYLEAKEAIMLGQSKNPFCLPQIYRLFSLVSLSKQQISEVIEYLNIALSNAENQGNKYEVGVCSYYMAVSQFLFGDIFNSFKFIKKSSEYSLIAGSSEWVDRAVFFEGRLEFELGRYNKAADIFQKLNKEPVGSFSQEKNSLFLAWIYRCEMHLHNYKFPKPEKSCHDMILFEIEAAYLCGNYEMAVELAETSKNPFSQKNFLFIEYPQWDSGYTQCEHLYFSHGEIHDRIKRMYHALALSHLTAKNREEAIENIKSLLNDEQLCEIDPWDAFYYYAKYHIQVQAGSGNVDLSSAVSMAFTRLQRRASHIENVETRIQFMNGSKWIRELYAAAKEFKLI